jgi:Fur family ferric uptake transcriptional regulator
MQGPNLPSPIPGPPDGLKPVGQPSAEGMHRLGIARQGSGDSELDAKSSTSRTLISQKPRPIRSKLITSESISLESVSSELSGSEPNSPELNSPESGGPESGGQESISPVSISLSPESFSPKPISPESSSASVADTACLPVSPQDIAPVFAATKQPPIGVDDVYRHCRNLGMRLSRQRRMVLDLLWVEKSHLSARDIFERLNNLGRNIGHTSVYQNLEALQSAGVIECLDRASGRLYGYRSDPHSHLTCTKTGRIQDLDVELPAELLRQIEAHTGYAIESYTMQFTGHPLASL